MGCSRTGNETLSKKSEMSGGQVLRKLISKAEKRKSLAQNVHIYALLQSTILRLKLDDKVLRLQSFSCKRTGNERWASSSRVNLDSGKRFILSSSSSCVESSVSDFCIDDEDPLQLNSFFEELKSR